MPVAYEKIAARNVERLAALSDGLFAIAMTLLIIDLHTPAAEAIRAEADLLQALLHLMPQIVMYFIGFMTLGIFWIAQQSQIDGTIRSTITATRAGSRARRSTSSWSTPGKEVRALVAARRSRTASSPQSMRPSTWWRRCM